VNKQALIILASIGKSALELTVPKLSARRQLALPASQRRLAGIKPGDECRIFAADGRIAIMRQQPGSARGCLAHLRTDETISDEQSRQHAIEARRERLH